MHSLNPLVYLAVILPVKQLAMVHGGMRSVNSRVREVAFRFFRGLGHELPAGNCEEFRCQLVPPPLALAELPVFDCISATVLAS